MSSNNADTEVYVTSVGACTAVGATAPASAAAVRAGISKFVEHPYLFDKENAPMIVAMASYLPAYFEDVERFQGLALPAVQEALIPVKNKLSDRTKIAVIIGLPQERPGLPGDLTEQLLDKFEECINGNPIGEIKVFLNDYPIDKTETLFGGHSIGLTALEAGCQKIQQGEVDFCLVGSVDSYLEPETLKWLDEQNQLHSETNAWGFIPGEAAGFCLLTSRQLAERYQLKLLAQVLTVATAQEKNLIKTETVCTGEGLSKAFKKVLQVLPSNTKVNQVIGDMNGEPYRADEYGFTIARTSEYFVDATKFIAPADCWGDVGAASGPLFLNLAIAAGLKNYSKGPYTLLWTSSETSERAAALIQVDFHLKER